MVNLTEPRMVGTVVGLGESLFDVFADRQVLGGAPLNVAVMADQVLRQFGGAGFPVSRIGDDPLGLRMRGELSARGVRTDGLQIDSRFETGRGLVELDAGEPRFVIVEPAAWDCLEFDDHAQKLAAGCSAVCFGTLGQRATTARKAIEQFLEHAGRAHRLFDVNLRQDYYSADIIRSSLERATMVKLNERELTVVARLLALPGAEPDRWAAALLDLYPLRAVVVTHGSRGTQWVDHEGAVEVEAASYPAHSAADSVGAGDAASAGLLAGLLLGWPTRRIVRLANHLGAFVAAQPGATPILPNDFLAVCQA